MNIRKKLLEVSDTERLQVFDYYKSIGCSDNQSLVLSLYTYGGSNRHGAFSYFYNKYIKSDKSKSFCDFISDLIIKVMKDNRDILISEALSNSKEYRDFISNKFLDEEEWSNFGNTNFGNTNLRGTKGARSKGFINKSTINFLLFPMTSKNTSVSKSPKYSGSIANENFDDGIDVSACCEVDNCFEVDDSCETGMFSEGIENLSINSMESSIETKITDVLVKDALEKLSTDRYELIEEKGFLSPLSSPTSTFRMTSNTAAFGILRKNKGNSRALKESMVRIEELLNNFEYKLSKPTNRMFNINTQICEKPNSKNKLLFVGVQGKDIIPQRQNITLLLDTSGSMSSNNVWTQAAMITVVKQLKENDVLSLVTYSDNDCTVIENMKIDNSSFDKFIELLYGIDITGCTWGSKGIETAYELANKTYIEDGINRVILMTDGDLNFGITDKGGLKDLILSKKDNGIFLSVLGTGLYNYKDDTLETLSKNGNGNYCTIDCIEDVKENIFEKYNSLVFTIAKDVKAQVEFNPKFVKSYRLIGYENRALNHEDFRNDAVISEPFGCGSYGVALYELEMQDDGEIKSDLKYQQPKLIDSENICTVSVRYKEPLATESQELSVDVRNKVGELKDNILLAYIIYVIGEKLRNSEYLDENEDKFVLDMLYKNGMGELYEKNSEKFKTLLSFVEK